MARLERPITRRQSLWLLAAAVTAFTPLARHMPFWLSVFAVAAFAWRGWLTQRGGRLPARWLLVLLATAGCAGVFIEYRSLFGRTPGIALLLIFLSLKLMELRAPRDAIVTVLLCYFLTLGQFLFTQTIPTALLTCAAVILTTAALLAANNDRPSVRQQLHHAGSLLLQALPFMLLLFLLFPRITGPLWGMPEDRRSAVSGLTDTMAPGSIAQVSQSDAVAFRVAFKGTPPVQASLYWRGLVMPDFDGRAWRVRETREVYTTPPHIQQPGEQAAPEDKPVNYELTLEPHGKRWLFALESPLTLPAESALTSDYQLLARQPVRTRQRYALSSSLSIKKGVTDPVETLRSSLALPANSNPRTRALAAGWRKQHGTGSGADAAIVKTAEDFFNRQLLNYTLNPPLAGQHSVDEFLFDNKRGFCEHFASAFAFALRAAGVPARVVAGYQGGEINPVDGYLVVRQYDAHAWTEAWLAGQGWVRIDPTAIAAPRRIDGNLANAIPAADTPPFLMREQMPWLKALRYRLDALNNGWNQRVLGYDSQRQRDFLQNFGLEADTRSLAAILATLCGLALLILTFWMLRQREKMDPARRAWRRFTRKLAKRGVVWQVWEGPDTFALRAAQKLPEQADKIHAIARCYANLRYARPASPADASPSRGTAQSHGLAKRKTQANDLAELNQHIDEL
jgi:transglutaminase-like putative cysteine protease